MGSGGLSLSFWYFSIPQSLNSYAACIRPPNFAACRTPTSPMQTMVLKSLHAFKVCSEEELDGIQQQEGSTKDSHLSEKHLKAGHRGLGQPVLDYPRPINGH